jgi:hypothetical protein
MPKDTIFINALVPMEDDIALRFIGASLRLSRSELVRMAISEFIENRKDLVDVSALPRPDGAESVPVVEVPEEVKRTIYPMGSE